MEVIGVVMQEKGFRDLLFRPRAKESAVIIYRMTGERKLRRDLPLLDQMRRAALSTCCNIAEVDERDTNREAIRFFYIAKGSLAELSSQLKSAHAIGCLATEKNFELQKMRGAGQNAGFPDPGSTPNYY